MPTNPAYFDDFDAPLEEVPVYAWDSVPIIPASFSTTANPLWAELTQNLKGIINMNELEKAKMLFTQQNGLQKKKVMPPQEKIPVEKLAILFAEAKQQISFYEVQVKQMEKEYQDLYTKFRDMQLKLQLIPDLEETHHAIQVYCKINRIPAKIRKSKSMVQEFIGALEHKDVPIGDDELVD